MPCERMTDVKNSYESFTEVRVLRRCDKNIQIFHTCDRFVWLSHSNISATRVKNSHVFVTSVKNSNEFFTCVTNTCEFFTRLKVDTCDKLVPIKISKLVVRKFHTYQKFDVFVRIIHSVWKIEVWILRFNKASFISFNTNPRFPPFLLYVRCKLGITFVRRCTLDVWVFSKDLALTIYTLLGGFGIKPMWKQQKCMGAHVFLCKYLIL